MEQRWLSYGYLHSYAVVRNLSKLCDAWEPVNRWIHKTLEGFEDGPIKPHQN